VKLLNLSLIKNHH